MGSTGLVDNWNVDPLDVGPLYPFVGSETWMFAASVAFCIVFIVWKFSMERDRYTAETRQLRESDELRNALAARRSVDRPAENENHA